MYLGDIRNIAITPVLTGAKPHWWMLCSSRARSYALPMPIDLGYNPLSGEVSEWFMVPLSKSGLAFGERGFESHPLRQDNKVNEYGSRTRVARSPVISTVGGLCRRRSR